MNDMHETPDFSKEALLRAMRENNTVFITEYCLGDVSPYVDENDHLFIPEDDPSSDALAAYARENGIAYYVDEGTDFLALMAMNEIDIPDHVVTLALLDNAERLVAVHREPPDDRIRRIISYAKKTSKSVEEYIIR